MYPLRNLLKFKEYIQIKEINRGDCLTSYGSLLSLILKAVYAVLYMFIIIVVLWPPAVLFKMLNIRTRSQDSDLGLFLIS